MNSRTQRNNQHNETMKANKSKKTKNQVEAAKLLISSSVAPHKTSVVPPFLSLPKP